MATKALQHVVVRMHYDARFVERVYADPRAATADCELGDDERSWLVAPDPRAYGVDPLRRSRSLTDLLEEFAVSVAAALHAERVDDGWTWLDAFFSSDEFHATVQAGGSLAAGFADWLSERTADPLARGLVAVDAALARARRARGRPAPEVELALAPGVEVAVVVEGTFAAYGQLIAALREHPEGRVRAALLGNVDPGAPCSDAFEGVLVDGRREELCLEGSSEEIAGLLQTCARGTTLDDFRWAGETLGATAEDCDGLIESFAADGLLLVRRP